MWVSEGAQTRAMGREKKCLHELMLRLTGKLGVSDVICKSMLNLNGMETSFGGIEFRDGTIHTFKSKGHRWQGWEWD